ncbi:hypothetical protein M9458_010461, partial [Cirrhinus mrigala]
MSHHQMESLFVALDQVREPATTPTTREKTVDSESVERSSARCTMAEGELIVDLRLLEVEGVSDMDVYTDLPPLFPPLSEPPVCPVLAIEAIALRAQRFTNAHPPTPASSPAVVWKPLCSPSAHHSCGGIT